MRAFEKLDAGPWSLDLLSPCSYRGSIQLEELIRLQVKHLPEAMPSKWDNFQPLGFSFDPHTFSASIPDQIHPGYVLWERNRKPKAEGAWTAGIPPNFPDPLAIPSHSSLHLRGIDHNQQSVLTPFMQNMPKHMSCDIGFLEWRSLPYAGLARQNLMAGYILTTHTLRHWLPDMLWGMVFGPPYVRMFGLQKLLSAPAHTVVQLGPESVYMQLTEDLRDNELRFEHLQAKRMEVKIHLGIEHFWQPDKAYDRMEHPENAGKVFKVPVFELWQDPPMKVGQKLQNLFKKIRGESS